MMMPLDALVVTEGNEKAVRFITDITQEHDHPVKIFLVGPSESGKTMLMRARQLDKDLLSTKSVLYRPCKELPEALRADVYDGYLNELGETDVLLLDDLEGFFEDEEIGPMMCKLLLQERDRKGNDTVISSRKPLDECNSGVLAGVFDDFVEVEMASLAGGSLLAYVKRVYEQYRDEEKSPVLSEEALSYLAFEFDASLEMKRRGVFYLMNGYAGEPGAELSRAFVQEALRSAWEKLQD